MSEITERAARAAHKSMTIMHIEIPGSEDVIKWDDLSDDGRSAWESIARAAIAATRSPSEAMLRAARDWSYAKYGKPIGNDAAIGCWQAMNDAALETS